MQNLIVTTGNVGCGKTTWVREYTNSHDEVFVVDNDSLSTMLGGKGKYVYDDRYWKLYSELKKRIVRTILEMRPNATVIIDGTHMAKRHRETWVKMAHEVNARIQAVDFGPGTDASLQRRQNENRGTSPEQWAKVHGYFQRLYERPDLNEGFDSIICFNTIPPECTK